MIETLIELGRTFGVEEGYHDSRGVWRAPGEDALLATLRAMDAPVDRAADAQDALRATTSTPWIEPVQVAWDGVLGGIDVFGADSIREAGCEVAWRDETGAWRQGAFALERLARADRRIARVILDLTIDLGYYELNFRLGSTECRTTVIAAPSRAHHSAGHDWGVFMPLHAYGRCGGIGTYADLRNAAEWIGGLGGDFVGTLPLLATFLGEPFEPSPYVPVSRLFWSDLFLAEDGAGARNRPSAVAASAPTIDYRATGDARRQAIERRAAAFFDADIEGDAAFRAWVDRTPRTHDYARFRATCDRQRRGWGAWPDRLRGGDLQPDDYAEADARYHLFAAWQADAALASIAGAGEAGLYIDLPLGVHPDGYDTWRERDLFATGAAAGAPPDPLFSRGQNWGFPPLKPQALRRSGYRYFAECLRHHMRHARILRLDHVMSLQRLYWIPTGVDASEGVYVRYPLDELLAVLCLESARHRAVVVGEDLGTVSPTIRSALDRHAIRRMFVFQFEAAPNPDLPPVPTSVMASLNTHDMAPFAAYWSDLDIADQHDLGLLDERAVDEARSERERMRHGILAALGLPGDASPSTVLEALLAWLAAGPARSLIVNLEDLWLESRPQNVPGTTTERPNWRRHAAHDIDEVRASAGVRDVLTTIAKLRSEQENDA